MISGLGNQVPQMKICNTRWEADLERGWRTLGKEGSVYWRKVFLIWELNNVLANRNQFTLLVLVSFILIFLEHNLRMLKKNKHVIILNFFSSGICNQQSPTFLALGTSFIEDNFSMDWGHWGWFGDDSSPLHVLSTLFLLSLHQLHLRSSVIRSQRLETPALNYQCCEVTAIFLIQ